MVIEAVVCDLCGLSTRHPLHDAHGVYCCPACREVSGLLREEESAARSTSEKSNPQITQIDAEKLQEETAVFSLGGLWCSSCAWLIGAQLNRTAGVTGAAVSFIQRQARVTYRPSQISPKRVQKRIHRLGYRAWQPGEEQGDEEEAHWFRLLVTGVLTMHVMVLSFILYVRQWTGRASADTAWLANFFELMILVISVPVVLALGLPILRAGMASLLNGRPNTHTLIALGAFSAFGLSLRNFIAGTGGVYFDTAAVLLFLVALGRWLEMRAQKVSREAVDHLWQRVPPQAAHITPEGEVRVPANAVPVGARVRVRPGERFPVDGVVAAGSGDVDESLLTGEPEAVTRNVGDRVLAGTVSLDGSFDVVTQAVGPATMVGQIGRLLHQALWQRAPVERLADRVAALMVPTAVLLAGATFWFWTRTAGLEAGLIHALSVLLIACPCALGIATPLTLWLGVGRAASSGVILQQTGVLAQLAQVRRVFFDKTGTLTQRPLRLEAIATDGMDEAAFLARVTAVEARSEHPLAQAIVADAEQWAMSNGQWAIVNYQLSIVNFRALSGQGVVAEVDGARVWIGSRRLMAAQELALPQRLVETAADWQAHGRLVVYAGWNGRVRGVLGLGERLRAEADDALQALAALGVEVAVLTGDDAVAGARWQQQLGVPVHAALRPVDKVALLRDAGDGTLMVGDGINDGPALAAASVGVAMRQGTDVAQAAADAVLIHDDLRQVPQMVRLARRAMRIVRQNLAWAFVYNVVGLALAVSGHLQPSIAALFMVLSSAIVTTNGMRLRKQVSGDR